MTEIANSVKKTIMAKKLTSPGIVDVAKKAGVSPATVSRVIRNSEIVRPETAAKVQTAIDDLNYGKERALSQATSKEKQIAVIVPDIVDPFFSELLRGIVALARVHGYSIILCNSDYSAAVEHEYIASAVERELEGIILVPTSGSIALLDTLLQKSIHVMFLDRIVENDDISYVISDDKEGAYHAIKYLLDLGHKDILYLGGDREISTEKNRLAGYKKALSEAGLPIRESLIRECSFHADIIYKETQKIVRSDMSFTAVFAASDLIALSVEKALQEIGKSVPTDVSLIGYSDMPFSKFISLTTVSTPGYEMGKNAMISLMDLIEGRVEAPHKVILKPSVVFRSSCKATFSS